MTTRRSFLAVLGALGAALGMRTTQAAPAAVPPPTMRDDLNRLTWRFERCEWRTTFRPAPCFNVGTYAESVEARLMPSPRHRVLTYTADEFRQIGALGLRQEFGINGADVLRFIDALPPRTVMLRHV